VDHPAEQQRPSRRAVDVVHVHERQAVRVGVGQRVEQHRFHDAEDGGIRADAQRQRRQRDGGEARRSPEEPQRVTDVLEHGVDAGARSHLPNLVLQRFQAAQLEPGGSPRVLRVHAGADLLVHQQVERRTQLLVEVGVDAAPLREVAPETEQAGHRLQACSARAMATAIWFHCAASSPSCRRPAFVSV
jgi:hypothetical protein